VEVSIGDGDSADIPLDETLPKDKDYSDLAFVLRGLPKSVVHLDLLGFLGGSRDHELLNYGEIHHFLSTASVFRSVRFDDVVVAFAGGKLSMEVHGRFSVVVFEPAQVTITGSCAYPLEDATSLPPVSSKGLGNTGFGTVFVESTAPCFLFLGA
jgi:thiamine pyrophosphokinase